ncbi:MAG: nuclear transport factor 2 family protein [Trebonia sp.]
MALDPGDELRIGELVARYADAVNRGDAGQWRGTWAADAEWHLRTSAVTGRDAIVARWRELLPRYESIIQLVTRGWAGEAAGGARGRWNVLEILRRAGADRDCLQVTSYTDRYVRAGDGWLFAQRRLVVHYSGEIAAGEFTGWPLAALDA